MWRSQQTSRDLTINVKWLSDLDVGRFDPKVPSEPSISKQTLTRKEKLKLRAKMKKAVRVVEMAANGGIKGHVKRKRDESFKNPKTVDMSMETDLEPIIPGWVGKKDKKKATEEIPEEELLKQGFKYVDFRGK